jgi:phage/plasmid-like protein (TIGR03299 family)
LSQESDEQPAAATAQPEGGVMSHNITSTDNVFSVREPMWHSLGDVLSDYPTREEAQKIALPWNPVTEPLYRAVPMIVDGEPRTEYVESTDSVAVVRDDTNEQIGSITKTLGESLVTNDDLFDIAEAIQGDAGDVRYETGGSLMGGRKVWLLLRLNEPLVLKGDPNGATVPYYALQNNNDGAGAFRGQVTMTRIVCDNTSKMADLDAEQRGTEFVFRHTSSIRERIEEAKIALAGWRESITAYQRLTEHLLDVKVTKKQRELFVVEFVPMPVQSLISDRVVANVEKARDEIRTILASQTCEGIDRTAYGLVQAAVEYGQHVRRANTTESRFQRAYLTRDRLAADAVTLAQEVATA